MQVEWSKPAKEDMQGIQGWIEIENPLAAQLLIEKILKTIDLIVAHTAIGKAGRVPGTREFVIAGTPFLIVYGVPKKDVLAIFRVLHGARKWPSSQ